MSDEEKSNKEIKARIESIFPNPQTASAVVDLLVHKRPRGWGRKSQAPYYKEIYAKQVQSDIDRMIESGQPICWRYNVWCTEDSGITESTLYTRINQSIRYLVEQMDSPDHKYEKWQEMTRLERRSGVNGGIVIEYIPGLREGTIPALHAEQVQPKAFTPVWKQKFDMWLEDGRVTTPFIQEGLFLSMEEIVQLKQEIAGLDGVKVSVSVSSVKAIKTN